MGVFDFWDRRRIVDLVIVDVLTIIRNNTLLSFIAIVRLRRWYICLYASTQQVPFPSSAGACPSDSMAVLSDETEGSSASDKKP